MIQHVSGGADASPAMHAPVGSGTYDPERWTEVQAFVPHPKRHSRLADQVSKSQAMATVCSSLRLLGASELEIAAWRLIADVTDRKAWHAQDRAPVNYRRQCDLARGLGISERHWRRIETRLAGCGVLARMTADNGYRGRRRGQGCGAPISCGLSLEPALANFRALAGIVEEAALAEEARQEKALEARTARRRIGLLVASVKDIETRRWAKARLDGIDESGRPACPRVAGFDELTRWMAGLVALEGAIREALSPLPVPGQGGAEPAAGADDAASGSPDVSPTVENVANQHDMSGAPDSGVRCHIQPVQESGCMQGDERAEARPVPPPGRATGRQVLAGMTLDDLRSLASDEVALWLQATDDWQDAVPHLLRELGINVSAWHEACEVLQPPVAFLALVVIDRNRYHPDNPVLNPGGALRAFTARARAGGLDLARSVAGIRHRERQGRQAKGPCAPRRPS